MNTLRGILIAVLILTAFIAKAQQSNAQTEEKWARPVSLPDGMDTMTIKILIFEDGKQWVEGYKTKPSGQATDSSSYFLVKGEWMITTAVDTGNMIFDEKVILPFDNVQIKNTKISNPKDKKKISEINPPLEAHLICERVVYKYNNHDTITSLPGYDEQYRDKEIRFHDTTYLMVKGDGNYSYRLVVNDKVLLPEVFQANNKIPLEENRLLEFGITPVDTTLRATQKISIPKIRVITERGLHSFIRDIELVVKEDRSAMPPFSKSKKTFPWHWVVIGAVVLLAILFKFLVLNRIKNKEFPFDLSCSSDPDATIAKLDELAKGKDMNFKRKDNQHISFEITKNNVQYFVEPDVASGQQEDSFFQTLKDAINSKTANSQEGTQVASSNAQTLADLENHVAKISSLLQRKGKQKPEKSKEKDDNNNNNDTTPDNIEDLKKELKKYKDAFDDLKEIVGISDNNLKSVVNKVKTLKDADGLNQQWKTETGYNTPSLAKYGIKKDKDKIEDLEEKKKQYDEFAKKVKDKPESFKDDKEYRKLSDIIKTAEEADENVEKLKKNPELFDGNTPTGKMIAKGKKLDDWAKAPGSILKDNEFSSSLLATKVKQGILLEEVKNDIVRITNEKEFKDTDLQKVIGFVANNPKDVLEFKNKDLELYKLIKSLQNMATKAKNEKRITAEDMSFGWSKEETEIFNKHNEFLAIKEAVAGYGTKDFKADGFTGKMKDIIDDATRYQKLNDYRYYWRNIVDPLSSVLGNMEKHNENDIYNTRALMFYGSQFYSIACIMSKIFGFNQPTSTAERSVAVFKGPDKPAITDLGFPQFDEKDLAACKFEYRGGPDQENALKFLSKYMPMPFIFIQTYYDDTVLSRYNENKK